MGELLTPAAFLEAARVPKTLQPQAFGLWTIERYNVETKDLLWVGFPSITLLRRHTLATLHNGGVTVMEDSRRELSRHLPIWLVASGRVLVTGLGLGCVVRGLLISPEVEHVDVVEVDQGILDAVGPEFAGARVTLHHADALTWEPPAGARWDFAWHDIHAERALQVLHAKLLVRYADRVRRQGAWMFPRWAKRGTSILGGKREGSRA
jgi:hypothetical protein